MLETKLPKKREAQKMDPTFFPNGLSAEYQSSHGAQETDGGLQDLPRRRGAGRHPRLPDGDAGGLLPGVGWGWGGGEGG